MTLPSRPYAAFLFDMDGTLLTSVASAERAWSTWALGHGLDPAAVLAVMHGVRAVETVKRFAPAGADIAAEVQAITELEIADVADIQEIPGAAAFLASLPAGRWALVTSASRRLAEVRLAAAGMALPPVMICAEDVTQGKPAPDCFQAGARKLGVDITDCLVFEDAHAGFAAAKAAGADAVAITATHREPLDLGLPTLRDYRGVSIRLDETGAMRLSQQD
ncbi:glycerol-3-phosphatase [Pseudomonas oryzihabitans]|nr:glycerol-3-phosphatase [Pseudomonas psychrotolerans]KTT41541.1 glycerol-3-phosphatase [Pseudomonas psychrotolerans]KTT46553.1 glycerol-3-phosphatase [Pseudomonas psychrotolerans]KTT65049.1 glycerol-3-phosphatase [Pseudomonas psychrotolerans]